MDISLSNDSPIIYLDCRWSLCLTVSPAFGVPSDAFKVCYGQSKAKFGERCSLGKQAAGRQHSWVPLMPEKSFELDKSEAVDIFPSV